MHHQLNQLLHRQIHRWDYRPLPRQLNPTSGQKQTSLIIFPVPSHQRRTNDHREKHQQQNPQFCPARHRWLRPQSRLILSKISRLNPVWLIGPKNRLLRDRSLRPYSRLRLNHRQSSLGTVRRPHQHPVGQLQTAVHPVLPNLRIQGLLPDQKNADLQLVRPGKFDISLPGHLIGR